jgi:predicted nucleotidyltransferase
MSNQLSPNERTTLFNVLNRHLNNSYPVEVILFGSMVKGKPRPTSDIDVAIKTNAPLDKALWAKIEEDFELSLLPRTVDVVDYWRVTPEFQKIIDSNGQVLFASKVHPYRLCPVGYHWVKTHLRTVPPSLTNPMGGLTEVDAHCRVNQGKKESLTAEEIREIFNRFGKSSKSAMPLFTDDDKLNWNKYDDKIVFWTNFWNEIYNPKIKLDAKIVKALIGSESSFKLKPIPQDAGAAGQAMGLIQLTDQALEILNTEKSEINNFNIQLKRDDLMDPDVSISAGIRWLFHKKKLADVIMKHDASWNDAIINYKGYLNDYIKNPKLDMKGVDNYNDLLKKLKP